MSITVACRECDHAWKVKEELAGRKVKCPECGESVTVPEGDDPPRKRKERQDDEPRRKKKKSKKAKGGLPMGLVLGLVGGGAVLLIGIVVVLVVASNGGNTDQPGLSGGGGEQTSSITVQAGTIGLFHINCNEDQDMVVRIRTQLSDPTTRFEAYVEVENIITRKMSPLASGGGTDFVLQWKSPGFGRLPIQLKNSGPGVATCTITHNGF